MKGLKSTISVVFNLLYPFVAFWITNEIVKELKKINNLNYNVLGALILAILLIIPYAFLKLRGYEKSSKWYFISESFFMILFTLIGISNSDFSFMTDVWGIAFIGIAMVDTVKDLYPTQEN